MDKCIYGKKNGLWYELQGDYYLPCLKLPEEEAVHTSASLVSGIVAILKPTARRYIPPCSPAAN